MSPSKLGEERRTIDIIIIRMTMIELSILPVLNLATISYITWKA